MQHAINVLVAVLLGSNTGFYSTPLLAQERFVLILPESSPKGVFYIKPNTFNFEILKGKQSAFPEMLTKEFWGREK